MEAGAVAMAVASDVCTMVEEEKLVVKELACDCGGGRELAVAAQQAQRW